MKKSILFLMVSAILISGCSGLSPVVATATIEPVEAISTSMPATATFTLAPTLEPTLAPTSTPTPEPTAIPLGISTDNFSKFVVTTQYLTGLKNAVKDLKDSYRLDGLAISPDGKQIAIAGCTGDYRFSCPNDVMGTRSFLVVLDTETSDLITVIPEKEITFTSLHFSLDGKQIIYATYPQRVSIWDLSGKEVKKDIFRNDRENLKIYVVENPNGKEFAVVSKEKLMIFEYPSGNPIKELPSVGTAPQYTSDGSQLVLLTKADGSEITVYDTSTWEEVQRIKSPDKSVSGFAYDLSPDGSWIVTKSGSEKPVIRLWYVKTGEQIKTLDIPSSHLQSVQFSPDNKLLFISGYSDIDITGFISIWEVTSWQQIGKLSSFLENGNLILSPNGESILASNGTDIWRWSLINETISKSRETVVGFFDALSREDYSTASTFYEPDAYELDFLRAGGIDVSNKTTILDRICSGGTRLCLPVATVLPGGGLTHLADYDVFVQFKNEDGTIYKSSFGGTDFYVVVAPDADGMMKIRFVPYNE